MTDHGEFWCNECQTYYPDPLEELHRESHAQQPRGGLRWHEQLMLMLLGLLMLIAFILIVRP